MSQVLLTSETFVRAVGSISDNIAGKFVRPAIREAQDIKLRGVIGDAMLARLKALVSDGSIDDPANAAYKALLDRAQYLVAYNAIVEIAQKVTYKIANAGVVKTPDENLQVVDHPDMALTQEYYQSKADSAALDLQNFLLDRLADYPELGAGDCHRIKSNLTSAASCGIFLGGARGKETRR